MRWRLVMIHHDVGEYPAPVFGLRRIVVFLPAPCSLLPYPRLSWGNSYWELNSFKGAASSAILEVEAESIHTKLTFPPMVKVRRAPAGRGCLRLYTHACIHLSATAQYSTAVTASAITGSARPSRLCAAADTRGDGGAVVRLLHDRAAARQGVQAPQAEPAPGAPAARGQ